MKKFNQIRIFSIPVWLVILGVIVVGLVVWALIAYRPISKESAEQVCAEFYDDVKTKVEGVPGYTILNSKKTCTPGEDEVGNTDYYFNALFRVTKAGNESAEGIKANIRSLADAFPKTDYPVWIRNDAAVNGRPDTICVHATKQIQSTGEVYYADAPERHTDYTEPGSLPEYAPCHGL